MNEEPTALVLTSIASPNAVLRSLAEGCMRHQWPMILIGDRSSPADIRLEGCEYWGIDSQLNMPYRLAGLLPERHYARKNLGYLRAMSIGATVIRETDDDNMPKASFWTPRPLSIEAEVTDGPGWVNAYRYFTDHRIWPRGFPLERVQDAASPVVAKRSVISPIQQGLANGDPDVDAVYRMTAQLPVDLADRPVDIALDLRAWCPFNSQNTTWHKAAFPLLYLPSYCSFRMTDIWRSFVAQRIMRENGWHLMFHSATVHQDRNEHDLLKDFSQEIPGYLHNAALCERLDALVIPTGEDRILSNMALCYEVLIDMGLIAASERALLQAWTDDLRGLSEDGTA